MAAEEHDEKKRAKTVTVVPTVGSVSKTTLVYWDIRGLAQASRLALEYCGEDYDDVRIDAGDPADADYKEPWFKHKSGVGMRFANLPYLLDGDVAIPQSGAILRHICRKHGLVPASLADQAYADAMLDQLTDFDSGLTRMCYSNYVAGGRDAWVAGSMVPGLATFEAALAERAAQGKGPWFSGADRPTFSDFKAYEEFDKARIVAPEAFATLEVPTLRAFLERFEALPKIAAYLQSARYKARPLNNPHAQFK